MHSRRNALLVVSTGMIGGTLLPRAAKAQPEEFRRLATESFNTAINISEQYLDMVLLAEHEEMLFDTQELAARARVIVASNLSPEQPELLARVEYLELVDAMQEHEQSLNPIAHFDEPDIDAVFADQPPQIEPEAVSEVIRDVILEVLGVDADTRSVVNEVFEQHGVNSLIEQFMEFYEDGDRWRQAREMHRILRLIFSAAVLGDLENRLGRSTFARVLGRLAARAVPFLGWTLLVGDVLAAIYRHRERLGLVRP